MGAAGVSFTQAQLNSPVTLELLQTLARSDGFAFTQHALAPGATESSAETQLVKAVAFWTAWLNSVGYCATPPAPGLATAASGGTVANGTYGVIVSLVNGLGIGESIGSPSSPIVCTGTGISTVTITGPALTGNATGWYAYMTQANGSVYTRQQAAGSPSVGVSIIISAPPTSSGLNPQTIDTTVGGQYGAVVKDALAHLNARLNWLRNPSSVAYNGDRA